MKAGTMLWSLNLAQHRNFCLLEGFCQSLEEAPSATGQSATGHTHQLSTPRHLSMEEHPLVSFS